MRLIDSTIVVKDGSGYVELMPEEPEDMVRNSIDDGASYSILQTLTILAVARIQLDSPNRQINRCRGP